MLTREKILQIIDLAYAARARGDKAALDTVWAPGAKFRWAGDPSLVPGFPAGAASAPETIHAVIDLIKFHEWRRSEAVIDVERRQAAVMWEVTLSCKDKEPAKTELYDLWVFDSNGKLTNMTQFGDTAFLARMLSE